jgi:hypothetical protein
MYNWFQHWRSGPQGHLRRRSQGGPELHLHGPGAHPTKSYLYSFIRLHILFLINIPSLVGEVFFSF